MDTINSFDKKENRQRRGIKHASRNPMIGNILTAQVKVYEKGEGFKRIFNAFEDAKIKYPKVSQYDDCTLLQFSNEANSELIIEKFLLQQRENFKRENKNGRELIIENVKEILINEFPSVKKMWKEFSPNEKMILAFSLTKDYFYRTQVENILGLSAAATTKTFKKLLENEFIESNSDFERTEGIRYFKVK